MKTLLFVACALLVPAFTATAQDGAFPPSAGIPSPLSGGSAGTFAVVIEVLGALPPPAEVVQAQGDAIRMMEGRGLVLTQNSDQANCLVKVIFEPDGTRRMLVQLASQENLPLEAVPADGDAALEVPDAGPPDDGSPECVFDLDDYPFCSVGFFAPVPYYRPFSGRVPPGGDRVRDHRRPPANFSGALPRERRNVPPAPSRFTPARPSGWTGRAAPSPRAAVRAYSPPPSRSTFSAPASAASSGSRSSSSGRR